MGERGTGDSVGRLSCSASEPGRSGRNHGPDQVLGLGIYKEGTPVVPLVNDVGELCPIPGFPKRSLNFVCPVGLDLIQFRSGKKTASCLAL